MMLDRRRKALTRRQLQRCRNKKVATLMLIHIDLNSIQKIQQRATALMMSTSIMMMTITIMRHEFADLIIHFGVLVIIVRFSWIHSGGI